MALKISVVPVADGWAVRSEGVENDMLFAAGAKAEAAARDLARRVAQNGRTAEVAIYLRDGALAGRFLHPAAAPEAEAIPA
jgi:hypothetical protein